LVRQILRKCVGCGELKPRNDMIKVTKEYSSQKLVLNPDIKTFGRSAYLCYNQNCIEQAFKKNKLNRILKTNKQIEKELILQQIKA